MKLSVSKEAQEVIQGKRHAEERVLLDFEDAIGPFVDDSVSCQLYPAFRLLLVPQEYPEAKLADYNLLLETEIGPIYMKERSTMLLDKEVEMMIEPSYKRLQIRSNSGILAANVPIKHISI